MLCGQPMNGTVLPRAKILQSKILVTCQKVWWLFLFGLVWQYSTNQRQYNIGRFKVMATYLQQWYNFEPTFIHWLCFEESWIFVTTILVCWIFGHEHVREKWHLVVWHPVFSSPWHYDDSEMELTRRVVNEVSNMHEKRQKTYSWHICSAE
jgi:hypothetical protein